MKALIFIVCMCIVSVSMAGEVETDCPAMNESREKIVKTVKPKTNQSRSRASAQ
ncbi:hypothetical protein ACJVC5_06365 [Peredibacter sp. HCB2-198]|uniref:hypothetical protein n=1 Tax=Peredibacter sp. HCB2-198 TaxID=3383025 RepID=UPI0038B61FD2